MIFEAGVYLS